MEVKPPSRVRLLATPWTEAYQAPPSMGFSRQEYWSGLPLPYPSLDTTDVQFLFMPLSALMPAPERTTIFFFIFLMVMGYGLLVIEAFVIS